MEGDFDTGNIRYKARERYSYGFSDPRCVFGYIWCISVINLNTLILKGALLRPFFIL